MKICFITGSRADYGLLSLLMKLVKNDSRLTFQLIATGAHFSKNHGLTYKELIKDKFKINYSINLRIKKDKPQNICNSMSIAIRKISEKLKILKPDIIILLGDRYEIFAACIAAYVNQIPICHLHGGELTKGSLDDSFRHSITKMSNIHLVSNKKYAERVKQLGENPKNIFTVGGFGVDLIKKSKLLNKKEIENKLKFKFGKKNIIVTYNPETIAKSDNKNNYSEILKALKYLNDFKIIFTKANADAEGLIINKMIDNYVKNDNRCVSFTSMGQLNYLSSLKIVDCVIGNSSSGLMEVPTFKKPTINVGSRQTDRMKALSVIDVPADYKKIILAVQKTYSSNFKKMLKKTKNFYGNGGASKKSLKIIKKLKIHNLTKKSFFDLKR